MKVKELITLLLEKDGEAEVWLDAWNDSGDRAVVPPHHIEVGVNPKDKGVVYLVSERD